MNGRKKKPLHINIRDGNVKGHGKNNVLVLDKFTPSVSLTAATFLKEEGTKAPL